MAINLDVDADLTCQPTNLFDSTGLNFGNSYPVPR